jgi:protein TonB
MHTRLAIVIAALLAPSFAAAAKPYAPKFARLERDAELLGFELCTKPEYPKSSLRNEETGVTTVRFTVAPTGRVIDATVVRSSGFRDLDKAAQGPLARCRFRPASIDGIPVQGTALIQYAWRLD